MLFFFFNSLSTLFFLNLDSKILDRLEPASSTLCSPAREPVWMINLDEFLYVQRTLFTCITAVYAMKDYAEGVIGDVQLIFWF